MLFIPIFIGILLVLAAAHYYLWRRLVRDTMRPGGLPRRLATAAVVLLPLTSFAGLATERAGAPFLVQQVLTWPGLMWLALLLYLMLALAVGELLRPLLLRLPSRGGAGAAAGDTTEAADGGDREAVVAALAKQVAAREATAEPGLDGAAPRRLRPPEAGGAGTTPAENDVPQAGAAVLESAEPQSGAATGGGAGRSGEDVSSRRLFVARAVALGATAAAVGTVGYGTYEVLGRAPRVKYVTVPLAKLPRTADGYRIAVVSDIHLGPTLGRRHTQRIVDTINRQRPDMIAVVGDLVDGTVEHIGPAAEPLRRLEARDGAYFVTGNHEYFSGAAAWVDHVRELGLHPLENDRTELPGFDLAGVNDLAGEDEGEGPDFERALGDRDPARASVLLAHQPVVIHDAVEYGVDLQLSGHTHGGQMWPLTYVAAAANPTLAGLERYGDTQLYVTRGAGTWGPPVRVGARSDITVVRLASKQA